MRINATIMTPENVAQAKKMLRPDRYGRRMTLAEVGKYFGVSREYIRQKCGNVGRRTPRHELKRLADDLRVKVYRDKILTIEQVAVRFDCSVQSVKNVLGSKFAFERSIGKRECVVCGKWLTFDHFYICNKQPRNICKPCDNRKAVIYMKTHRERTNELARQRNKTPQYKEYRRVWWRKRMSNPVEREKIRARARTYYWAHRAEIKEKNEERRQRQLQEGK